MSRFGMMVMLLVTAASAPARGFHEPADFDAPALEAGGGGIAFTGAPRFKRWDCTACHLGPARRLRVEVASAPADLAAGSYQPGATYDVTVTLAGAELGTASAADVNGFVAELDDDDRRPAGALALVDPAATQLLGGGAVVADLPADGRDAWTFRWTAPAAGAGPLTLYVAAVDGNGAEDPIVASHDPEGDDAAVAELRLCEGAAACEPLPRRSEERSAAAGCSAGGRPGGGGWLALVAVWLLRPRRRCTAPMPRPRALRFAAAVAGAVVLWLVPATAAAVPAFARKYNTTCSTCHAGVFPTLNAWGRRFKERGYQLPDGAEEAYRDRAALRPGTTGERVGLLRELPISARGQSSVVVPTAPEASGRNDVDFRMLDNFWFVVGGSLYRDVSFIVVPAIAPGAMLHHGAVGVHDLLGEDRLNVRAGQLLLLDFLRPGHRSVTRLANPAGTVQVGRNPASLDATQLGFDAYGRLFGRRLFWHGAVVQGAVGPDGFSDLDGYKDVFGELQLTLFDEQTVGVFGYWGRSQITDTANAVTVRWTDPFRRYGGDLELHFGPVTLFAMGLFGRHDDPLGLDEPVEYWAWRGDAEWAVTPRLTAIVRYDRIDSDQDASLQRQLATGHASLLFLSNVRTYLELQLDVDDVDRSTVFLGLDLIL